MNKDAKIFIAGHQGMVGSALIRALQQKGYSQLITRSHAELDLTNQQATADFFEQEQPDYVILAAAKVGGILANNRYPADFIVQNLLIQTNVIQNAFVNKVKKLLFLGSSCIYPKLAPQPIQEASLLTGPLEPTNEPYAIAKIAGIKLCQSYNRQFGTNFIAAMPTNLYGPHDNFDLETAHVLPALLRKFHEAKVTKAPSVTLWGSGTPRREFLHVDDLAEACLFLLNRFKPTKAQNEQGDIFLNIGSGSDSTIKDLAAMVGECVGFRGKIKWDASKPDGTPRKLLDSSRIQALGWQPQRTLEEGLRQTYAWYCDHGALTS